jgi:uncharacterized protein YndB with AHSA1/START domain
LNKTITIAPVRKSIVVQASPQHAFEVFTSGLDRWWPKAHSIGSAPLVESILEPGVGGRWLTRHSDGSEAVIGHVKKWTPGACFVVTWEISAEWKSDPRAEFASEVEVRFEAEGEGRTRVSLEHRNFERMGTEPGQIMHDGVDGGWPGLLAFFAAAVEAAG